MVLLKVKHILTIYPDPVDDELDLYVCMSMTQINSCISQTSSSSCFIFCGKKDVGILHICYKYLPGGRGGLGVWGHGQMDRQ